MKIDWIHAPDWAEAVGVRLYKSGNYGYAFICPTGYNYKLELGKKAKCHPFNDGHAIGDFSIIEFRPKASAITWTGEGLPPVGSALELQAEVLRLFSYDPKTGSLKWKDNQQERFIGREAGFINHHGYRRVNLGKTKLHAHQIIWLMKHGELPECEIDHINGIRDDNRLENLRLVTQQENQQNAGLRIDNALGVKGVRLRPSGNYQARVKLSDGSRAVKTFCTVIEAVSWLAMQREISHGDYANTPEQIAAEELEAKVKALYLAINWNTTEDEWACVPVARKADYRKAIEEGWQKVSRA